MTAVTTTTRERAAPIWPAVVHTYTDALRVLEIAPLAADDLAQRTGRVASNVRRDVHKLVDAGVVYRDGDLIALTYKGVRWLDGMTVADGGAAGDSSGVTTLRHAQLAPSPLNPRQDWTSDDARADLDALMSSIITHGLQQNLVVAAEADAEGKHAIIAGERRWRAIGMAIEDGDLEPTFPIPCRLQSLTDQEHEDLAAVENMVRRDLHPIEEGRIFARWRDRGRSTQASADLVGRTQRHVQERIKLLELGEADQARMRLPKDDPQHLTLAGARELVQDRRPGEPSPPPNVAEFVHSLHAGSAPLQIDVEDVAPRTVELTPAQSLILHEIEAATREQPEKSSFGPAAKIVRYPQLGTKGNEAIAGLVGEGMVHFGNGWPAVVSLLPPGVRWLATAPGGFMDPAFRLHHARREYLGEKRADELGASGEHHTDWLNVPKPPAPVALTPEETLILLEIVEAIGKVGDYATTPVQPAAAAAVEPLQARGLLVGPYAPGWDSGLIKLGVCDVGHRALSAVCPGYGAKKLRAATIEALRLEAGDDLEQRFATPWLNGPFEPDAKWAAKREERAAQDERAAAEREEAEAWRARIHVTIDAFEAEAPDLGAEALHARFVALLADAECPAPWRPAGPGHWNVDAFAANGRAIGDQTSAANRLQLIALNLAAGIPAMEWPASDPSKAAAPASAAEPEADGVVGPALSREAFESVIAEALLDSSILDDAGDAAKTATEALDSYLADTGGEYGQAGYRWDVAAAQSIADEVEA